MNLSPAWGEYEAQLDEHEAIPGKCAQGVFFDWAAAELLPSDPELFET